jgi:hypothetical protein
MWQGAFFRRKMVKRGIVEVDGYGKRHKITTDIFDI